MPYLKPLFVNVTEPGEYTYNPHNCDGFSRVMINASGGTTLISKRVPDRAQHGAEFVYTADGTYHPRPSAGYLSLADPTVVVDTTSHWGVLDREEGIELWDASGHPVQSRTFTFELSDEEKKKGLYGWCSVRLKVSWAPRVQRDWEDEVVWMSTNEETFDLKDHDEHWVPGIHLQAGCKFALTKVNKKRPIEFDFHRLDTAMAVTPGSMGIAIHKDINILGDDVVIFTGYYAPPGEGERLVYPGANTYRLRALASILPTEFSLRLGGDDDKNMIEAEPEEGSTQRDITVRVDTDFFDCSAWSALFEE